ncbi:MAG TPA: ADP-ribosylglycohydrolase family protein [Candidatus Wallbacteria bacterium]|nr:ADP-ribosylglycohydrolase family protein [Candidatus Wallbacteria bacterium]
MIGAIAGDIIGSVFERHNAQTKNFELFGPFSIFTDDSVLTVAIADSIMNGKPYAVKLREYFFKYPNAGYGGGFVNWALTLDAGPYNSYGNGSAMRVSPVGWVYDNIETVISVAKDCAQCTHNHPEGIKGAQAVAAAIFLARKKETKRAIKSFIAEQFGYDLDRDLEEIRKAGYKFDVSCQGSVPEAIIAFLGSDSYESAIRRAIWLGGDSDTIACISGSIAEAFYGGVPDDIKKEALSRLNDNLRSVTEQFILKFILK